MVSRAPMLRRVRGRVRESRNSGFRLPRRSVRPVPEKDPVPARQAPDELKD